jgi:hypothetical protein
VGLGLGVGVGVAVATGTTVIATLITPTDRLVPTGVTSSTLTVSLAVRWDTSIGSVLTEVSWVSTEAGPLTVTLKGTSWMPVTL